MIASMIVKRMMRSGADKAFRGDVEATLASVADDVIYDHPLDISVGGTVKGKKAIIEWYRKWYEQSPRETCLLRISPLQLGH